MGESNFPLMYNFFYTLYTYFLLHQQGKKRQQFTFELGSPAKMTSPVAKSTPATDDVSRQTNVNDSHLRSLSFPSSNSDDAVYPHPSPHKIVIDVDGYDDKNHSTTRYMIKY